MCVYTTEYADLQIQKDHGILEFQLSNGTWGTICSNGFDSDAAVVACKQLGYNEGYYDFVRYIYIAMLLVVWVAIHIQVATYDQVYDNGSTISFV